MLKITIATFLLCILQINLVAQSNFTFRIICVDHAGLDFNEHVNDLGRVQDQGLKTNYPVRNAQIILNGRTLGYTDTNGELWVTISTTSYHIEVNANNYEKLDKNYGGHPYKNALILELSPIHNLINKNEGNITNSTEEFLIGRWQGEKKYDGIFLFNENQRMIFIDSGDGPLPGNWQVNSTSEIFVDYGKRSGYYSLKVISDNEIVLSGKRYTRVNN